MTSPDPPVEPSVQTSGILASQPEVQTSGTVHPEPSVQASGVLCSEPTVQRWVLIVVGVVVAGWAALAIPARATTGARTTADEPQYLLTALSLWEDHDLDISDEIDDRRYESFHEAPLDPQTQVLVDGREISPHDPLLPLLLAPAMGLGGWVAAKAALAVLAGCLAASLLWVAVGRLGVSVGPAATAVLAFGVAAPLTAYGSQVYPELPAALLLTLGIAWLTGGLRRWELAGAVAVVVALPWLGVKFAPVAAVLFGYMLVRLWRAGRRRELAIVAVVLMAAAGSYLLMHRATFGGWTSYASGDHFRSGGELSVVGNDPDYAGRTVRLVGLVTDRDFGLAAWAPVYLLAVPAFGAFVRRRPPGWELLVLVASVGWAVATWVALTMHGWWWPGRQVVVVLPCVVLITAWWVGRVRAALPWLVALAAVSALSWGWLLVEVWDERLTLIVSFAETSNPLSRSWRAILPDLRSDTAEAAALQVTWAVLVLLGGWWGWRREGRIDPGVADASAPAVAGPTAGSVGCDEDATARELPDPDVLTADLDGDGAVRRAGGDDPALSGVKG